MQTLGWTQWRSCRGKFSLYIIHLSLSHSSQFFEYIVNSFRYRCHSSYIWVYIYINVSVCEYEYITNLWHDMRGFCLHLGKATRDLAIVSLKVHIQGINLLNNRLKIEKSRSEYTCWIVLLVSSVFS